MGRTIIASGADQAVKRYSAFLTLEAIAQSYWLSKFMGVYRKGGNNKPITLITDLEKAAGDVVTYDLFMRLRGEGVEGDDILKGNEEKLVPYTDTLYIDQKRHGVDTGGKMTKKRTVHDLRAVARDRLAAWFAEQYDENFFAYLAGIRGSDTNWVNPVAWTGRASNSFSQPDADHLVYGGDATRAGDLAAEDIMDLSVVDKLVAKAKTIYPKMQPIVIDGKKHFVLLMHTFDAYNLRTNTSTGQWLDIQKAAAAKDGQKNPIFSDALGIYHDVILHEHEKVVRFDTTIYGVDAAGTGTETFAVPGSRCLFFGAQAGALAFGSPGEGLRYDWHEELEDRGNVLVVDAGAIFGVKKCIFNSKAFGVVACDVASTDPNA